MMTCTTTRNTDLRGLEEVGYQQLKLSREPIIHKCKYRKNQKHKQEQIGTIMYLASDIRNSLSWMLRAAFFCRMLLVAMAREGQGESFHLLSVINRSGSNKRINDENRSQISRKIGRRRCDYQIITEKIDVRSKLDERDGFQNVTFQLFFVFREDKKSGMVRIISFCTFSIPQLQPQPTSSKLSNLRHCLEEEVERKRRIIP